MSNILVVGSLAYDDVQTPTEHRANVLGGAASYFAIAARLYAPVRLVGVVGDDFREEDVARLRSRGIDLTGLERRTRGAFPRLGRYDYAMNTPESLNTDLQGVADRRPPPAQSFPHHQVLFLPHPPP